MEATDCSPPPLCCCTCSRTIRVAQHHHLGLRGSWPCTNHLTHSPFQCPTFIGGICCASCKNSTSANRSVRLCETQRVFFDHWCTNFRLSGVGIHMDTLAGPAKFACTVGGGGLQVRMEKKLLCFEWSPPWHFKTACWHHFCLKLLSRDFCPTNYPNHLFHLAGHCACQSVKQDINMSVGHVK